MNLILLEQYEIRSDGAVELRGRRAAHVREVLRAKPGERLRVGVIRGARGEGRVRCVGDAVTLELGLDQPASPRPAVDLILAMPRPKALRRLLGHVAAIGVARVDLVNAWRVDKSYLGSPVLGPDVLREALVLGCEQGATTWLPDVAFHSRLMSFLDGLPANDTRARLVAEPGASSAASLHPLQTSRRVALAIGPEGGWIESELETLARLGFHAISFGEGVMRVEAAVVACLAQLELLATLAARS